MDSSTVTSLSGLVNELKSLLSDNFDASFAQISKAVNNLYIGTLGEYITHIYVPWYKKKHTKSFKDEMLKINIILTYDICQLPILQISEEDILSFLYEIREKRKISKTSVNRYRARLSNIFYYATSKGHILMNPIKAIKKYKEKRRTRTYSLPEIHALLLECKRSKNKELYVIVISAFNTGMRKSEILRNDIQNLDFKNRWIFVPEELSKSKESRYVPMNDALAEVLTEHLKSNGLWEDYVNGRRKPLFKSKCIRISFENAKKRAGIYKATFHDIRRSFATYLNEKGHTLTTIGRILGHLNASTTEAYLAPGNEFLLDVVQEIQFN